MKRLLALFLSLIPMIAAIGSAFGTPVFATGTEVATPPPESLSAASAVLMEADDGIVLYEKNAHTPMGMASTTKIMTALLSAELLDTEAMITVPKEAVGVEGSSVYLVEGEKLSVRELLYALMLASANDAAVALAVAACGSVEAFCERMNERATSLGLENTHFVNPHGLANDDHYTTASDLAVLAAAVLKHPLLRQISATKKATIAFDGTPNGRYLVNHNKMLSRYEGAIGLKTGFTKKTGRCLVSAAERDGLTLVAVTLDAPDDWRDHTAMLDYGFSAYRRLTLFEAGEFSYSMPLVGGTKAYVTLRNTAPITLLLSTDQPTTPSLTVETLVRFEYAPLPQGQALGHLICVCGDQRSASPLITAEAADAATPKRKHLWSRLTDSLTAWFQAFGRLFQAKES